MCSAPGIMGGMEPHELEAAKKAIATELDHMTPQQQAAVLTRVAMESSRREIAARYNSPGKLAQSIDPSVKQTPALEVIDEAFEWALNTRDARLLITCPPQEGKLVAHDTPVPTPTGWTTHGELRPGDKVIHPSGRPVTVMETHPEAMATLRVHIDGLDHIDVHPRHEWNIYRKGDREARTVETQWLMERPLTSGTIGKRGSRYKNHLPHRDGFNLPEVALPIDPYTLGLWLGDGRADTAYIFHAPEDKYEYAYPVTSSVTHADTGVIGDYLGGGFLTALRALGLLNNKHIPSVYLRASENQRRALLAGLIDSDGHVPTQGNQISFDNTSHRLVGDVAELIRTLGYRAGEHQPIAPNDGGTGVNGQRITGRKDMWRVTFSPHDGIIPTRLPRYEGRINATAARRRIPITGIEEIPPRPGRCITVDSPDGLYLVGRTMVPTHNSSRVSIWGVLRALVDNPDRRIILASYSQSLARQHSRHARNIIREHGFGAKDPITDANLPDKLGLQLAKDDSAATSWSIRGKAGGLFAVGVGGALTGSRADLLCIDDPMKGMAEADSILERRKVVTWWESVAQTRLAPGAPVVVIMTRWHEEDLAGYVLQKDKLSGTSSWRVVNIPAIAAEGVPDALGREPGEAMESARGRTLKDFERIRNDVGERVWSALYMGQPTPAQGGLFNQEWFDRYRVSTTPPTSLTVVSVDPAETGHRDEAGIICLTATPDGVTYMTDDRSGRMQSDEWARAAVTLALETNATTLLYEAYTTRETYERVITNAWRQIRDETRLLARHDGDLTQATLEYAEQDDPPTNPYRCLKQVADLPEQTVTNPPFRIEPWTMKGNKTARAAGTRQASSTGRLRLVGTHPVLEAQAAGWQPGQNSPDRMDALVNAYEYLMKQLGRASHIATPQETTTTTATGADFWNQTLG